MDDLRAVLSREADNAEAWRLLAQAQEAFLDYAAARTSLERAISLGGGKASKHDLKKLALLKQGEKEWRELHLTADQLQALGAFLQTRDVGPDDRSLRWTRQWLAEAGVADIERVLQAIQQRGAFSDFQVLRNIVVG
jgi:hypothetical protein